MDNGVDVEKIRISGMGDEQVKELLEKNAMSLTVDEARKIVKKLKRDPTLVELHIFNAEWSEHCSYKSSRESLKMLPTKGSNVILGPQEDAGIIFFTEHNGERYGIVAAHESHNHPSQVVPYEGAATGIGGIVRDVICMGAKIIATADPLRFGDPEGKDKNRTKYIANAVIDGIAGYGNPIGIPNIAGDMYFSPSFDDNCLVNVVSLGLVNEKEIIHSSVPQDAEGYDIVIVGKATDNSGFGGVSFASLILDEEDKEQNKGAVQVPDPFLKNVLIRATETVFKEIRRKGIKAGFKDMGGGGLMCSTSELGSSGGYGMEIDLDKVHISMDIPDFIITCSETQERFTWVVPPEFTPTLLRIYNEDFALPDVAKGARASVVGKVIKDKKYILWKKGMRVCNAPIDEVTSGIKYKRKEERPENDLTEPSLEEPADFNQTLLLILSHHNVCSREIVYKHYDTEVMGQAVIRPGEADAGLITPIPGSKAGVALSVDANPRYTRIDPYMGAVNAVAESMRNVAAIGATPSGLTDCLCYGNPEKPDVFWQFREGVKGVAEAAKNIYLKGTKAPVPVVSGNVSFYNESATGKAVDPSPIIACIGVMDDYRKAITMGLKKLGTGLYLLGLRKDELGGSVYYDLHEQLGRNIPKINFDEERSRIYSVIEMINNGLALSCHDISDGGLGVAISEMILSGSYDIGARLTLTGELSPEKFLFSESPGFVLEIENGNLDKAREICMNHNVNLIKIGETGGDSLSISYNTRGIINTPIERMRTRWNSLKEVLK
jgi:phosphoribosylformylglycinamidine synthase